MTYVREEHEAKRTKDMARYDIDIKKFYDEFNDAYEDLYNDVYPPSDVSELVREGDAFLSSHGDFVGEFARYRQDYLTSNREIAAFMLALSRFI